MSERSYTAEDERLFQEIKEGRTFNAQSEMPSIYRKNLENLLWMQADSEYAGGVGYMPWIAKAPTAHERVLVAQIVKDEMRHAHVVFGLLDELGHDTAKHMEENNYSYRIEDDLANIGFQRPKKDFRVNIFYYPITYWTDFILFNFLMDRAAGHQLQDTLESSYEPWKKAIGLICKEEAMHLAHGDKWVKILATGKQEDRDFLQKRLNLWWPRVMNVFGSSKGQSNDIYVRLGLKKRFNQEIRQTFLAEIQEMCKEWKLTIPEYDENEQKR